MSKKMRAVFSIVDYSKGDLIAEIYKKQNVSVFFATHGNGAAPSAMLELLGFGENKKSIMLSILDLPQSERVFAAVEEKMNISKPGKGIMFSIPLTGATAFLVGLTDSGTTDAAQKGRDFEMAQHEFELIITIVTKGYSQDVKAAANAAGARGGTLIHALGTGSEEAQKFLGITIQPEKEIVMILVPSDIKDAVLHALYKEVGLDSAGQGIAFAMPVDRVVGISEAPSVKKTNE